MWTMVPFFWTILCLWVLSVIKDKPFLADEYSRVMYLCWIAGLIISFLTHWLS